jgi:hypothetical protein
MEDSRNRSFPAKLAAILFRIRPNTGADAASVVVALHPGHHSIICIGALVVAWVRVAGASRRLGAKPGAQFAAVAGPQDPPCVIDLDRALCPALWKSARPVQGWRSAAAAVAEWFVAVSK